MPTTLAHIFEIERALETVVIVPQSDLREFAFQQIEAGADEILQLLDQPRSRNVVMDLHKTDYFGSAALGFFMKLWQAVRQHRGRMAFCNISAHEKEIFRLTKLDQVWLICASRTDALKALREPELPDVSRC